MNVVVILVILVAFGVFILGVFGARHTKRLQELRDGYVSYLAEQIKGYTEPKVYSVRQLAHALEFDLGEENVTFALATLDRRLSEVLDATEEKQRELFTTLEQEFLGFLARCELTLAKDGGSIFPVLISADMLNRVLEQFPNLLHRKFGGLGPSMVYALDRQDSLVYLNAKHLSKLSLDEQSLHQLALENLRNRISRSQFRESIVNQSQPTLIDITDQLSTGFLILAQEYLEMNEEVTVIANNPEMMCFLSGPAAPTPKPVVQDPRALLQVPLVVSQGRMELLQQH